MQAGFADVDITPPPGTLKIGWLKKIVSDTVLDPLYARVAIIRSGPESIAFVQTDLLSVRWTFAEQIRAQVAARYGFPGDRVMVSATHNHAGPAVANCGEVPRDEAYLADLLEKVLVAFGRALKGLRPAQVGIASCFEFDLGYNRRVIMRDGTVCTHGSFSGPDALCMEGPIDPEVAVLAARDETGKLMGALVNFACHPTHHGGGTAISAGFPGVMADIMKQRGCPVTLFLNGAGGNIATSDPCSGKSHEMEPAGQALADDVSAALQQIEYRAEARLSGRRETVQLPYREVTGEQIDGTVRGAQRFVDPALYDRGMPALLDRIRTRGSQPAEVQVLSFDEFSFAGIPAEYFVQHGLRIKQEAYPRRALVVGWANGMVGYVPHREAFQRGGYETTFAASSRMAPQAGDILADCAIRLIHQEDQPS